MREGPGTETSARGRWRRIPATWLWAAWLGVVLTGLLLGLAAHGAPLLPGDLTLAQELQEPRALGVLLRPVMVAASGPGFYPWAELLYGGAVGAFLLWRRWAAAALVASTVTGDLMAAAVKLLVARPRPSADLLDVFRRESGYSFPSGHVVHYVVFFGVLGYLAWGVLRATPRGRPLLRVFAAAGAALCAALVGLIGASRVYLGAHWPTDVVGGYLLGGAWLALLVIAYRAWHARHAECSLAEGPDRRRTIPIEQLW